MNKNDTKENIVVRPPVVVVMGHVDHGKSTLLDYIRKTNIVDKEAGGITQHISAYEVSHKDEKKQERKITFLDTPGHEAFSKMRERGANTSDIAILIVSAEDSVKAQTIEAYNTIIESKIPYIVAINKIDKPNANIEKTKMDLIEKGIYLEGFGGDIPYVPISAKSGEGVNELLDMILLVADMQDFKGNKGIPASGTVIEAKCDPKRGISASMVIKDGTLKSGMFVVAGHALVKAIMMENFLGKPIKEASFSSPIRLVGFNNIPEVGSTFISFPTKEEANEYINILNSEKEKTHTNDNENSAEKSVPIIIKTDVAGTIEAIEKEIFKLNNENICFKIVGEGVGAINESDLKMASIDKDSVIVGFNVKIDNSAKDLNESLKVEIKTFDIIYHLADYLKEILEERKPVQEVQEMTGNLKVLKVFGITKGKQVIGGKVVSGKISHNSSVKIMRRDFEIGTGKISEIQLNKMKVGSVEEGSECGILMDSKIEIAQGDNLEAFTMIVK